MEYKVQSPVAFIIFNRPDITQMVFKQIRKVRPAELYVIADGPRTPEGKKRTDQTRAVIDEVDWDCHVHKNYSEKNLGGKWRPSTGISWVFEHVSEAIFLEDDNLPNISFFRYCDELLARFRNEGKIFSISGANFFVPKKPDPYSYWFSSLHGLWGWATWKRSWDKVDLSMTKWGELRTTDWLKSKIPDPQVREMYASKFDRTYFGAYKERVGVSYAYLFAMMLDNAFDTRPEKNLISNIGFRPDANNTTRDEAFANIPTTEMSWPLRHPPEIKNLVKRDILVYRKMDPNVNYIKYTLKHIPLFGQIFRWGKRMLKKISRIASRILKSITLNSDYRFSLGSYVTYIFEELAHKKMEIKELSSDDECAHLQIQDFLFYWPINQGRKELSALWQELFNPVPLNPHAYEVGPVNIHPGDTVIDAGTCEGFFTHYALQKNAKVFAFEPLETLKQCLAQTFAREIKNGQVFLVPALLGNENRLSGISADPAMLCMSSQDESGNAQRCEMITLDRWMEDEKITKIDFIKMDIEGAEVAAMQGAEVMIKKFKPRLAIAVYHEYKNAILIRDILKSYRPDYHIQFRGIWDFGNVRPRPYMLFAY